MKNLFLLITIILSFNSYAQKKNVYYDKDWKVCNKENAAFYRTPPKKNGDLWLIKDYYINGKLQFEGKTKNIAQELWEGDLTWYLPNGKILDKVRYKNGIKIGVFTTYEGVTATQEEGYEEKDLYFYDTSQVMSAVTKSSKDTYEYYYVNSKQIAILNVRFTGFGDETNNDTFFDKQGNITGKLIYDSDGNKYSGTDVIFYETDSKDSIVSIQQKIAYNKGLKNSVKYYNTDGLLIAEGQYKDEKPYQGTFFKQSCFNKVISYRKGKIIKEKTYKNNKKIATLSYKNGKKNRGIWYDCDSEMLGKFHIKKGLKNGAYELINYGNILEKGTYKKNKLIGTVWYYTPDRPYELEEDETYRHYNVIKIILKKGKVKKIIGLDSELNVEDILK